MALIGWKTIGVSIAGFSHQATDMPCQDFHSISSLENGWLVGTVSDGAGSAPRSAEGAKAICKGLVDHIVPHIVPLTNDGNFTLTESIARSWIVEGIEVVRSEIIKIAAGHPISDFHATLVGVIAGPSGGVFFHIGDGAACATDVEKFSPSILSQPENGECANETFFFTQPDWQQHIRLTPFDRQFNLLALMSDGVTPFALKSGTAGPYEPFFGPLSRYLKSHTREEGQSALAATLEKDAIRRITGDDKTLVWALRIRDG
jgi:Protein phosphatase 2C